MNEPNGSLLLWGEKALFLGMPYEAETHSHYVLEICIALNGWIHAQATDGTEVTGAAAVLIAPHVRHRLTIDASQIAVLFVGPATPQGLHLRRALGARSLLELSGSWLNGLIDPFLALAERPDLDAARGPWERLLYGLEPKSAVPAPDRRILQTQSFIHRDPASQEPVGRIARTLGIQQRTLGKMFRRQIGMPVTAYRRWIRLRSALATAFCGETLTTAAHEAGFSDSAHLTRTCQETFGVVPSRLPHMDCFIEDPHTRLSGGMAE